MPNLKFSLLTGRTIGQGQGKEYGKLSEEYRRNVAICEMDPSDIKRIKIKAGQNVKVTSDFGSVVVKAVESSRAPHPGSVFIPCGSWANLLVDPSTHGTGMPSFKGISVEIEPAPKEEILSLPNLLNKHYRSE
jgi:formylmethanofuran dehydrogenase subunit D